MTPQALNKSVLIDTVGSNLETGLKGWLTSAFTSFRRASGERALIRRLSQLDDALLRDIGIADDEIWRVRRHEAFTPRAWL